MQASSEPAVKEMSHSEALAMIQRLSNEKARPVELEE